MITVTETKEILSKVKIHTDYIIADVPTINGRIYSTEVVNDILNQMQMLIKQNKFWITTDSFDYIDDIISPDKIIGRCVEVEYDNGFNFVIENLDKGINILELELDNVKNDLNTTTLQISLFGEYHDYETMAIINPVVLGLCIHGQKGELT